MLTKKITKRSFILLASFALFSAEQCAHASGWIAPNHLLVRVQLETLTAFHQINVPITTWPIPSNSLTDAFSTFKPKSAGNVLSQLASQTQISLNAIAQNRTDYSFASANHQPVFQQFGTRVREKSQVGISRFWSNPSINALLSVNYSDNEDNEDNEDKFLFDRTYIDFSYPNEYVKNWRVGIGAIDRWWGPGWDSTLILSNNARPIPGAYISRNTSKPFQSKWLNWIGPWQMTSFMGQLEAERAIPNALFWGMRIAFKPFQSLEIGLSRSAIWAGDGRPKDFGVFKDLLTGIDNFEEDDEGKSEEPGNQLGGIDLKYSNSVNQMGYSFYIQAIGEDEAGGLPSRPLGQIGLSLHFNRQYPLVIFSEFTDTSLDAFGSEKIFGSAYEHGIYQSGYRYKGRAIGSTFDNDTQALSIGGIGQLSQHWSLAVVTRNLRLNRDNPSDGGAGNHTITNSRLKTSQIDINLLKTFQQLTVGLHVNFNSNKGKNKDGILDFSNSLSIGISIEN